MSTTQPTPARRTRVERNIYRRVGATGKIVFEVGYRDSAGKQRWQTVEGGITADERFPAVAAAGLLLAWRPKALLPAIALAGVVAALLRAL